MEQPLGPTEQQGGNKERNFFFSPSRSFKKKRKGKKSFYNGERTVEKVQDWSIKSRQ